MKNFLDFTAVISQDEDGMFIGACPAIPGCHSQGETYEEAQKNIEEAITLCLNVAKNDLSYRSTIDFNQNKSSRFVGITKFQIPEPAFV